MLEAALNVAENGGMAASLTRRRQLDIADLPQVKERLVEMATEAGQAKMTCNRLALLRRIFEEFENREFGWVQAS